ncbi:MAG TPA: hypothetical protein VH370_00830 [Humisphaera sp.]|jgi:hypothetical protein|nr:hypothetical protein [Humisphaera sp.]
MLKEEVKSVVEREPFRPYRIHLQNGKRYDVPHRDVARFLGYGVLVFIGMKEGTRQAKGYDRFPFDDIARIENLRARGGPQRKKAS